MLQAVNIGEAKTDDNQKVMEKFLSQMGFEDEDTRKMLAELLVPWIGDQLTVARLRSLLELLSLEPSQFHRYGWLIHLIALLHTQMAHAKSLHTQYYLTDIDLGFAHAFNILRRKNLANKSTKGPFHHNLEEAIYHVTTARMRDAWLSGTGAETLADLRAFTASELISKTNER